MTEKLDPTPHDPIGMWVFPDEEQMNVQDLRRKALVDRVCVALQCLRHGKIDLTHHTLVFGPNRAYEEGYGPPERKPVPRQGAGS